MARPTKQGIDYFPVDVQFDEKVELYIADVGAEGLGILVTVWQLIYQNEGYYIKNNDDLVLLIRRRIMASKSSIKDAIKIAIERGIFDKELNKKHNILTSKAIQKRFFVAARKKKEVSAVRNYIYKCVSTGINVVYSAGNATKEEEEEEVEEDNSVGTFSNNGKIYEKSAVFLANIITSQKNIKISGQKLKSWANSIRLLITKDGVSEDRLRESLAWYKVNAGCEYVPVIESGKTLREKFIKLEDAIQRSNQKTKQRDMY